MAVPTETSMGDENREQTTPRGWRVSLGRTTTAVWIGVAVVLLAVAFQVAAPSVAFFSVTNLQSLGLESAEAIILAVGTAFVLGAGLLDLSIGANLVLSSVAGGEVMDTVAGGTARVTSGHPEHVALAVGLAIVTILAMAVGFGIMNGLLVTRLKLSSFIVTLGTMGVGNGLALVIVGGVDIGIPTPLQVGFGVLNVWVIPAPLLVAVGITACAWYLLARTRFGVRALAMGSSRAAAERAGIKCDWLTIRLFALMGLLVGVASVIDLARFAATDVAGQTLAAMAAITAAVIGGTSLFGGRASVIGAAIGALLPAVMITGLVVTGVSAFYQQVAIGVILLLAVSVDRVRRSRAARGT